jgi:PhoH-like ATPase
LSERFTGFRELAVPSDLIDQLYKDGEIGIWDPELGLHPNLYLELRDICGSSHTALARVTGRNTVRKLLPRRISSITPRNREQVYAQDALQDDTISVVVLTGIAGSGKTMLALSVAMEKMQEGQYDKVILTRPMSEVGRYKLGALPGDVHEKFNPYLLNYTTNLEQFVGSKGYVEDLLRQSRFEIIPIQLIRGASFNRCFIIADELQVCNHTEILTIGTRVGEDSKIVLMGDLNQRDEAIAKEKTGLYKLMYDKKAKDSPLVASIELQKCERSETAKFFSQIFEEE